MKRFSAALFSVLALALAASPSIAQTDETFLLKKGQRVLFLGDSNTFAGLFVAYLDGYLMTRFPAERWELINLGLPSETVSGLSEPDHPYPRPDIHTRLEKALVKTRPDVVVACYGMNDGIYHPFSDQRFERYKDGIQKLVDRVHKEKATVVLMTPAPFDPLPVRKQLLPATAEKFSWMSPYEQYDDVLKRYSEWLLGWRDKKTPVADPHSAIHRHLAAVRKDQANYVLSGDGIHPNPTGHGLIALELLQMWKAAPDVEMAEIDAKTGKVVRGAVSDLAIDKGNIRFVWKTRIPMPADPRWDARFVEGERIVEQFNRHRLQIIGAPFEKYQLVEGGKVVGEATRAELEKGVDLTRFGELSTNVRSKEVGKLTRDRERLLGLAWLTDVGHKRPDTPKGEPLEQAQKKAAEWEQQIRTLAEPRGVALELRPATKTKRPG